MSDKPTVPVRWDVDPDEWPHTPPFHVFRALMAEDDNTWWRAGSGHGLNAYEAAVDRVEELEARAEAVAAMLVRFEARRPHNCGLPDLVRAALRGDA